ncbi:LacI family DNA-binding transcriptional regulator [Mycoplasmopsis gallopavonis]|uniref:LacI family transcriptional regulator n=1 Tax=Mycoplasmopsis gallopavonis TaxID=76629 RepID=A0A449AZ03_9BACT|nr:LacI family DNA-binding transcriptional regulator [Mycoplasmopsis gallopavonis]RIV16245.1 LacI family transcriptional regulator [Mycoplasmopsis gallopavonis]VEU72753.1 LacI family transcriptional regulator [Mycoplasmopsis gallopavonis]
MKKQISYKDISELAGVSISTISRYYNKGYVSKKTKDKIDSVVKQYQYFPNHGARLIRGKDHSIFVIMPIWGEAAYSHIVNGIIVAAKKNGKRVNTSYTGITTEEYIATVRYILSWRPTSVVIFVPQYDKQLFDFLKSVEDVNFIIYGHQVSGLSWIKPDETNAFYQLTKKFHEKLVKDNQKMLFLADEKLTMGQKQDRFRGFEKACEELKIEYEEYSIPQRKQQKDIVEFDKYTKKQGFSNIICSTHEAFISLAVVGTRGLRLTDIGYTSIYDNINNYKAKIFVDYAKIGYEIERMLCVSESGDEQPQTKFIRLQVI